MKKSDNINWKAFITDLLEIMVFTKARLALKCDVSEMSISNWTAGRRRPQGYAYLVLLNLAKDNDLNLDDYKIQKISSKEIADPGVEKAEVSKGVMDFVKKLSLLPKKQLKQILEMADLMIEIYNSNK